MNERIRELALEAGYTKDMFGVGHWDMPECKKFAELIVRDCLYIVEPMQDNNDEWCVTLKATAQAIKEHFGVEE